MDYSDLYDIMTFFRGAPDGTGAHDDLGAKIGAAGKLWARDHVRNFFPSIMAFADRNILCVLGAVEASR